METRELIMCARLVLSPSAVSTFIQSQGHPAVFKVGFIVVFGNVQSCLPSVFSELL